MHSVHCFLLRVVHLLVDDEFEAVHRVHRPLLASVHLHVNEAENT